jgi:hypothetical protein
VWKKRHVHETCCPRKTMPGTHLLLELRVRITTRKTLKDWSGLGSKPGSQEAFARRGLKRHFLLKEPKYLLSMALHLLDALPTSNVLVFHSYSYGVSLSTR